VYATPKREPTRICIQLINTKECRVLLGETAEQLTDEQIQEIRDWHYELANIELEDNETR